MKPTHHLDDSTLLSLAAGTLDAAFSVVAASHVAVCPQCRTALRTAEALGGGMIGELADVPVSGDCRERTLAALGHTAVETRRAGTAHGEIPPPIARLLGSNRLDDIDWKWKAPGVAMHGVKLPGDSAGRLTLMRIGAGRAMPEHGHGGGEITLVLKGAYRDHMGRFAQGDIADLDTDVEHQPVVDGGEECICLVATERLTRFKSLAARLIQPFVGI